MNKRSLVIHYGKIINNFFMKIFNESWSTVIISRCIFTLLCGKYTSLIFSFFKDSESLEQILVENKATCDANQVILDDMSKTVQNDQIMLTGLLGKVGYNSVTKHANMFLL